MEEIQKIDIKQFVEKIDELLREAQAFAELKEYGKSKKVIEDIQKYDSLRRWLEEDRKVLIDTTSEDESLEHRIFCWEEAYSQELSLREQSSILYGDVLMKGNFKTELAQFIVEVRPLLKELSKAKAAKVVRILIDKFFSIESDSEMEVRVCEECIEWAINEKRIFLEQALQTRLVRLYYNNDNFQEALRLTGELLPILKRLDDKQLLVEVELLNSLCYFKLQNDTKARASLTTARTTANGIYCPPTLQAQLDMQSGILHSVNDNDYKTAFSYFYEAFDGFNSTANSKEASRALKYMMLCKIMLLEADEVNAIMSGKTAINYHSKDTEAIREVAIATMKNSLQQLLDTIGKYKKELVDDDVCERQLQLLQDELIERNLLKLIRPYSRIEVIYLAKLIQLDGELVEKKLSSMILDKKFHGILDQGSGDLLIFDEAQDEKLYKNCLEIISEMNGVVDRLYTRTAKLR